MDITVLRIMVYNNIHLTGMPDATISPKSMGHFLCSMTIVREATETVNSVMHRKKNFKPVHRMKT